MDVGQCAEYCTLQKYQSDIVNQRFMIQMLSVPRPDPMTHSMSHTRLPRPPDPEAGRRLPALREQREQAVLASHDMWCQDRLTLTGGPWVLAPAFPRLWHTTAPGLRHHGGRFHCSSVMLRVSSSPFGFGWQGKPDHSYATDNRHGHCSLRYSSFLIPRSFGVPGWE